MAAMTSHEWRARASSPDGGSSTASTTDTQGSWEHVRPETSRKRAAEEAAEDVRSIHSSEFAVRSESTGSETGRSLAGESVQLITPVERLHLSSAEAQAAAARQCQSSEHSSANDDRTLDAAAEARSTFTLESSSSAAQSASMIDPSPTPPPPNEATARRMEEIRDQLVSLLTKHQAPRAVLAPSGMDASTPTGDNGSSHTSRSGASTPTQSGIAAGRYTSSEVFGAAAISIATQSSQRGPSATHGAACEMCGENLRSSIRWVCLDCPGGKWNACDECFGMVVDENHPHHTFVKVMGAKDVWRPQQQTQLGSRIHRNASSVNEYADPKTIFHLGITCSACQGAIIGARYRCATPDEACKGVNLCENCEASPIAQHPRDHPLLKYKLPIDSCKEVDLLDRTALDGVIAALLQNEESNPFTRNKVNPLALLAAPSRFTPAGRDPVEASISASSAVWQELPPSDAPTRQEGDARRTLVWQAQMIEDGETPWGSSVEPGAIFAKSWKVQIPDESPAWTNGARIARQSMPTLSRPDSHTLRTVSDATLWPGSVMTITLWNLRAPELPGTYEESWRLVDNTLTGNNFGDPLIVRIRVQPHAQTAQQEPKQKQVDAEMTASVHIKSEPQGKWPCGPADMPMSKPTHGLAPFQAMTLTSTSRWGPNENYTDAWKPRNVPEGATLAHSWQIRNSSTRSWPLIDAKGPTNNIRPDSSSLAQTRWGRTLLLLRKSTRSALCCGTDSASFLIPQKTLSPGQEACITIRGLTLPAFPTTSSSEMMSTVLIEETWQLVTSDGMEIGEPLLISLVMRKNEVEEGQGKGKGKGKEKKGKAAQVDWRDFEMDGPHSHSLPPPSA